MLKEPLGSHLTLLAARPAGPFLYEFGDRH